jgi:molybdopterin converting factor small subunit
VNIKVKFHGELKIAGSEVELTVPKNADIRRILTILAEQLGEEFKRKLFDVKGEPLERSLVLVAVNDAKAELEQTLKEGDVVDLFPLKSIGGG